jgi:hypothetical protein
MQHHPPALPPPPLLLLWLPPLPPLLLRQLLLPPTPATHNHNIIGACSCSLIIGLPALHDVFAQAIRQEGRQAILKSHSDAMLSDVRPPLMRCWSVQWQPQHPLPAPQAQSPLLPLSPPQQQ